MKRRQLPFEEVHLERGLVTMPTWSESQKPWPRQEKPRRRTGLRRQAFRHDPQTLATPARCIRRVGMLRQSAVYQSDQQYAPLEKSGRPSEGIEIGRPILAHKRFQSLCKRANRRQPMQPENQAPKK